MYQAEISLVDAPSFVSIVTADDGEISVVFEVTDMIHIGEN
jgi:hypothetical protein